MSILEYFKSKKKNKKPDQNPEPEKAPPQPILLSKDMNSNIEIIKNIMGNSSDLLFREFTITPSNKIKATIILIKGMVERELINEQVI